MQFSRLFTADANDPYADLVFVTRESKITKRDGTVVFRMDVVAPEGWTQTAVDMLAQKYCRKAGVPALTVAVAEAGVPGWLRRRTAADGAAAGPETDARRVFDRIVGCWTYWGWKLGYFKPTSDQVVAYGPPRPPEYLDPVDGAAEENARAFYDEHRYILAHQLAAPNSPQWFNAGIHWAYGITGADEGRWAIDHSASSPAVSPTGDAYSRPNIGACYILNIEDTLLGPDGIMDFATREARIFKGGSGSGANYSPLRGANEPLSHGGKSSGLMSWLKGFDSFAGAIKSGGTNRRCARMIVLDADHPDVEAFVDWKMKEEKKVGAMVAGSVVLKRVVEAAHAARAAEDFRRLAGVAAEAAAAGVPYNLIDAAVRAAAEGEPCPAIDLFDTEYEGAAYETVSGQNANNSVRVTNEFMRLVEDDGAWNLFWRTEKHKASCEERDPNPCRTVRARELWHKIARAAWECADPGVQFHDTCNDWNPVLNDSEIQATNPCCLVGETLVDTSEGKISIARLVEMFEAGVTLPMAFAFAVDTKRPVLRPITKAWVAGHTTKLVRVTTDKGVVVTCTPEHRFLNFAGGYVRADHLHVGTSLRKISRHTNTRRSGRVMITDPGCGHENGTEYQSVWMWEQAHGPVPAGHEVHHRNGDPTDDRLSNLECKEKKSHRSLHAKGTANNRFITVADSLLVAVYEHMTSSGYAKCRDRFTVGRWNKSVRALGLLGKVPLGRAPMKGKGETDGVIQGVTWSEFVTRVLAARDAANDKVVAVETVVLDSPVPVYDIEVDGTHNFAVTNDPACGRHTLVVHNSEFNFLDNTTCNLAALNLVAHYIPGDWVETVRRLRHSSDLLVAALDVVVSLAGYPSASIAEGALKYRTIGLGYGNLGALVMRCGLAYDSPGGRGLAACLTALIHYQATLTSAKLAAELGAYPRYAANAEHQSRVVRNHAAYLTDQQYEQLGVTPIDPGTWWDHAPDELRRAARRSAEQVLAAYDPAVGLRNAQLTLTQPTGTIGLVMDCDTLAAEPDFSLVKYKRLAGGGDLRLVNQSVRPALATLGYDAETADRIVAYIDANDTAEGSPDLKPEHLPVFDTAATGGTGTRSVGVDGHLLMMAVCQPVLSGSISKTCNLPRDATVFDVERVYTQAWRLMIKAVALYRDYSKLSQPLKSSTDPTPGLAPPAAPTRQGPPTRKSLPGRRSGYTQKFRVPGHKLYLTTGTYPDGSLGEIFLTCHKEGSAFRSVMNAFAQAVSIGLQYGVPLEEFVDAFTFTRFEPGGPVGGHDRLKQCTSLLDAVFRDLAIQYLGRDDLAHVLAETGPTSAVPMPPPPKPAETKYEGTPCVMCGAMRMVRDGKCLCCQACGATTGCA